MGIEIGGRDKSEIAESLTESLLPGCGCPRGRGSRRGNQLSSLGPSVPPPLSLSSSRRPRSSSGLQRPPTLQHSRTGLLPTDGVLEEYPAVT